MKRPHQPKKSHQSTEKPTIRLGKEDFVSPSPLARYMETKGVSKAQKRVLEHDEGPSRKKKVTSIAKKSLSEKKSEGNIHHAMKKAESAAYKRIQEEKPKNNSLKEKEYFHSRNTKRASALKKTIKIAAKHKLHSKKDLSHYAAHKERENQ